MPTRPEPPPVADLEWYLRPPHTVYYAATYDCGSYCAYCNLHTMVKALHGGHRQARAREMDLPTVRRLLDEARAVGVALFKIGGGEPFDASAYSWSKAGSPATSSHARRQRGSGLRGSGASQ